MTTRQRQARLAMRGRNRRIHITDRTRTKAKKLTRSFNVNGRRPE